MQYKHESITASNITSVVVRFLYSFIPNRRDSIKSVIIKIIFIAALFTFIISGTYLIKYFYKGQVQKGINSDARDVWYAASEADEAATDDNGNDNRFKLMLEANPDFKGWIKISNTLVDNPIFQANDDEYYLKYNQKKERSSYGALFFEAANVIAETGSSQNLTIYGHQMKDGQMFGSLSRFRKLDFYKENPNIELETLYSKGVYKIFAIMIINATPADDNGYVFRFDRSGFSDESDFRAWSDEAYSRSLINTGVDVLPDDDFLCLITCNQTINNGRLVIMSRRTRSGETEKTDTSAASVNSKVRYPKRWYDDRGRDFPFD